MRAVGLDEPLFVRRASGSRLEAADGRSYIDWVMSWGPLLFGHADPETVDAVVAAARDGTSFGAATEREVELAAEDAERRGISSGDTVSLRSKNDATAGSISCMALKKNSADSPLMRPSATIGQ